MILLDTAACFFKESLSFNWS